MIDQSNHYFESPEGQNMTKAEQFANYRWAISKEKDPLAGWVLAKIAYQHGDIEIAKQYYEKVFAAVLLDQQSSKFLKEYITQENDIIQNKPSENTTLTP